MLELSFTAVSLFFFLLLLFLRDSDVVRRTIVEDKKLFENERLLPFIIILN